VPFLSATLASAWLQTTCLICSCILYYSATISVPAKPPYLNHSHEFSQIKTLVFFVLLGTENVAKLACDWGHHWITQQAQPWFGHFGALEFPQSM
jgi:hypothetical protein